MSPTGDCSWLGGALVSAQCCVAFSHMSLVWRFSFFVLVLLLLFLAIPIHLMMHKSLSLQLCWPGQHFTMPLVALCVLVVFGFWFCLLLFLFFFLFSFGIVMACSVLFWSFDALFVFGLSPLRPLRLLTHATRRALCTLAGTWEQSRSKILRAFGRMMPGPWSPPAWRPLLIVL